MNLLFSGFVGSPIISSSPILFKAQTGKVSFISKVNAEKTDSTDHHAGLPSWSSAGSYPQSIADRLSRSGGIIPGSLIKDGTITTNKLADGAVSGDKIVGLENQIFGTCTLNLPAIPAGGGESITCQAPNGAEDGDRIVATINSNIFTLLPAPVLMAANVAGDPGDPVLITFQFINNNE